MSDTLDLLLKGDMPDVQKKLPTAKYKVERLSEEAGADVVFTLRALPRKRVEELKGMERGERDMHLVLDGVVEPSLKDARLMERYGAPTPVEVVEAMLLPGEIDVIAGRVEKLCGYNRAVITELKND